MTAAARGDEPYRQLGDGGDDIFTEPPLAWLPEYCLEPKVSECMRNEHREPHQGGTVPLMCVCGPVVWWMRLASALTWIFFFFYPAYAMLFCYCDDKRLFFARSNTMAVWLPFLPVLATTLWIEDKCLGHMIAIYVQVKGRITLLGYNFLDCDFHVWRLWMLAQSVISHLSIVSNGLLLARAWKTSAGGCDERLFDLWGYVIRHSMFHAILPEHFTAWAAGLWYLMLLQPGFALLRTIPIGPPAAVEDYVEQSGSHGFRRPGTTSSRSPGSFTVDYTVEVSHTRTYEYMTPLNWRQNHATAAYVLGCANRMSSITSPFFDYEMARIEMHENGTAVGNHRVFRILNHYFEALGNKLSEFWLVGIFENLFSLHMQISLFGLTRAVSPKGALLDTSDAQTLFSILLNMVSLVMRTKSVFDIVSLQSAFKLKVGELADRLRSDFLNGRIAKMQWGFVLFYATMVVYVILFGWAVCKTMALFFCYSGLFNIGIGCVQ